jgi:hypothetical protein
MIPMLATNRNYFQLCWVVPDIQASMASWTKHAGVGPFFYFDGIPFKDAIYRGKSDDLRGCTAAIAQAGDLQIELVAQEDDRMTIFREVVPMGKTGFHHTAIYSRNYEAERDAYIASGSPLAFEGDMLGSRTSWIDTVATLGFMTELVEANPVADMVFGKFREAAENWDGTDAVRTFG